jgi:hypothetical protein
VRHSPTVDAAPRGETGHEPNGLGVTCAYLKPGNWQIQHMRRNRKDRGAVGREIPEPDQPTRRFSALTFPFRPVTRS